MYDMYNHIVDHGWTSVLDHSRGALGTHRASAGLSRRERGVSNGTRGIVRRPQAANRQLRKLNPSPKFAPGKIQPAPRAFSICYPPSFIPTTTTQTYMTMQNHICAGFCEVCRSASCAIACVSSDHYATAYAKLIQCGGCRMVASCGDRRAHRTTATVEGH